MFSSLDLLAPKEYSARVPGVLACKVWEIGEYQKLLCLINLLPITLFNFIYGYYEPARLSQSPVPHTLANASLFITWQLYILKDHHFKKSFQNSWLDAFDKMIYHH